MEKSTNPIEEFKKERINRIKKNETNRGLIRSANEFMKESIISNYSYNFSWMGIPIIQYPQDMMSIQEIVWRIKPDLIIETGIAHGGSLVYYASLLEMIGNGEVLGIDIDIRKHNKKAIEEHPMFKRITMIEGSSVSKEVIEKVKNLAKDKKKVLICLDSNHTHNHVLEELKLYSSLVTKGSYLIVYDTVIEDFPEECSKGRPWGKGRNPKTAVIEFLKINGDFIVDKDIQNKLLITVAPGGYLKKIR